MKRIILIAITCIVVDTLKSHAGWLTKCKGMDVDGEVVFDKQIVRGQAISYRPFIVDGDEYIHGNILGVGDAPPSRPQVEQSSDTGKSAS